MGSRVIQSGAATGPDVSEELTQLRRRVLELEEEVAAGRKADAKLRESRDLFQSFMNNSPLVAYMKDEEGRYVYANRRIEGLLAGATAEWWGKTDMELWSEETARALRANDRAALEAGRTLKFMEALPQPDGEHILLTFKFPFTTGSGTRYLAGVSLDVTERARAEEERAAMLARERAARAEAEAALDALRRSEMRARRLFESNVIGIIEIETHHVVEANEFFLKITGYDRADLAERRLSWQEMMPRLAQTNDCRTIEELLGPDATPFETEIARKDGDTIPVLVGGAVLADSQNCCVCFVLELTERKQLEHRLLHAQKLESLGLLAGGVAHDFNNMLASMMGNASLSLDALSPSHPAYRSLAEVVVASRRASDLTQQLLAFSGRARFIIKPVDLTQLVGEISKLVETVMSKKIDLRLNLARDLPFVDADSAQMQHVIMNLVINASEAIGENPGKVEVTTRPWNLTEQEIARYFPDQPDVRPGLYAYLEVRDTGCGMTPETQTRIFDPFFTTKAHGHGLGLAAVLGIVRSHRGSMRVESGLGVGTTFQLLFPASREQPARATANDHGKPLAGRGLVLVVDDEEAVRRMAKATLERYGYTVVVAENGKQAVEVFTNMADQVSAVLLDMAMPVMNGREAARRMIEARPEARIVITSGYNESEAIDWIEGQGLCGFIQKPYTAAQLAERIKMAIER